ncbi:MAG: hypothetical protein KAS72_12445 [Phycisphaerales bacterium]|nr:hypothetical protein [Phycisphaerales bacterium]
MKTSKNFAGVVMLVALAGMAVSADPQPGSSTERVSIEQGAHLAHDGMEESGDYWLAFSNMWLGGSAAGLSVAYTNPASYTGGSTSTRAYLVPMSSTVGALWEAWDGGDGVPNDIWWDEYAADLDVWGGAEFMRTTGRLEAIVAIVNQDGIERESMIQFLFFNSDGDQFMGGAGYTYIVPAGYAGWFADEYNLHTDDPGFEIHDTGLICVDWLDTPGVGTDAGLGMMIAGGDLIDPAFPHPDTLWVLGETCADSWINADAVTNVDPMWDGSSGTSYADILNTGDLWNLSYVDDTLSPTSELCHDFPFHLYIWSDDSPWCAADLDGDDDTDQSDLGILLAVYGISGGGDLNGDGNTDQTDLGILLADYGCGP